MNEGELRKLIKLVEESEIDELEVRRWGRTIRIVKRGDSARADVLDGEPAPRMARSRPPPEDVSSPSAPPQPATDLHAVTSPMVGTFYRAPAPEAPAFVEVGDTVRPGQTLCILEAMKLMNELEAEVAGVIRKVHIENGQPVEYGQVLFDIEPA